MAGSNNFVGKTHLGLAVSGLSGDAIISPFSILVADYKSLGVNGHRWGAYPVWRPSGGSVVLRFSSVEPALPTLPQTDLRDVENSDKFLRISQIYTGLRPIYR